MGLGEDDPQVQQARQAVMRQGTVAGILAAQQPDGSWIPQGGSHQDTGTQVLILAEMGAQGGDARIQAACRQVLEHVPAANGGFSYTSPPTPSKVVHCHNAQACWALLRLGWGQDARLQAALEWQARAITGEGPVQYYKSGTSGPGYACGMNQGQPCAWGATKALRAFLAVPEGQRSPLLRQALEMGAEFLLRYDLARADFPYSGGVSGSWFKFGFPLSFWSDVLETAGVLAELGYGRDPRLAGALELIRSKQGPDGKWVLEHTLNGKMWVDIESRGQPSKWITLRAMKILNREDAKSAKGFKRREEKKKT